MDGSTELVNRGVEELLWLNEVDVFMGGKIDWNEFIIGHLG
jgi:hypothetical protein